MKAVLTEIVKETESISSFRLRPEQPFQYQPGQWMWVQIPNPKSQIPILKHHFTISSSPTEDFLQFTTMYRQESDYKKFLFGLKEGTEVDVSGAFGSFVLDETDASPRLFVAGGIGITPFRSMLKYAVDKGLQIPATLLYSVKTKPDAAFVNWLTGQLGNWLTVRVIESEKEGRLDEAKIRQYVPDYPSRTWWLCGPPAMIEAFVDLAQKMGLPSEKIRSEEFTGY